MRLMFLASANCPFDLATDEAHYWDWSRNLDWSYYSKGPLVAWLIRASCALVGPWSEATTGNLALAVRLPAVVCGALLLVSLYVLAVQITGWHRFALGFVAVALTIPPVTAVSTMMTIDSPYTCCWGWALVFAHRAVTGRSNWAWEATGLMVGLGFLAKYTMIMFLPSLGLFLLTSRKHRRLLLSGGFWSMIGITVLSCTPILIWNAQHDWVTLKHVVRLAGLAGTTSIPTAAGLRWLGPLNYVGGQAALMCGYWFVIWLCAMIAHNPLRERDSDLGYLWWMSAPMFLLFAGFSLKTGGGEINWPVTTYLSGGALAGVWLARQLMFSSVAHRVWMGAFLGLACLIGLGLTFLIHRTDLIHPLLANLTGPPSKKHPFPVRRFDPTCRLRGYRTLAAKIDQLRKELQATQGKEPILATGTWSMPGELGVYCAGHPTVYSFGLAMGDRHSQYDLWPSPISDPEPFLGRTVVLVGGMSAYIDKAFARIEGPIMVEHEENGHPIATWTIFICHGFKGFSELPEARDH
jgi:hypothetical protein